MESRRELEVEVQGRPGYVVVDRFVEDLAGGGLRLAPAVTAKELRRLARTMTHKWALLGLPFGGCKLGIRADVGPEGKEGLMAAFGEAVRPLLRDRVFTGPDLGTSFRDLRPFFQAVGQDPYDVVSRRMAARGRRPTPKDDYRRLMRAVQGSVTGTAVARAVWEAWRTAYGSPGDLRVAVQGFGSVGRAVVEELARLGARLVAVADVDGCLVRPRGLPGDRLAGPEPGRLSRSNLPGDVEARPSEAWLTVDADVLIPAAVADAIRWDNVDEVRARMVAEAANIPVPEDVEVHLHERGVLVLPDYVVNGGLAGAFGALLTDRWTDADALREAVIGRIVAATTAVVKRVLRGGEPPRRAAAAVAGGALSPRGPRPPR